MLSAMWRRWMRRRSARLSRRDRPARPPRRLPSLEWLDTRELVTSATPLCVLNLPQGTAAAMAGAGPSGYTPSQISQAYGFNQIAFTKNGSTIPGNGQGQTIAIVDAYDDPNIASDLRAF